MSEVEWQRLPSPMWPDPAVWTDMGDLTLLVFSPNGVRTWEVRHRMKADRSFDNLIVDGAADTFEAAKAATLFEAAARSGSGASPAAAL